MQLSEHIVQFIQQLPSDQQAEALNYILELGKKHNDQIIETIFKYLPQIVGAIALVYPVSSCSKVEAFRVRCFCFK
jgi:uncharacterized protein YbaP (TraB family)